MTGSFLRTGHGAGKGTPHIEIPPVDELSAGLPGDLPEEAPGDRGQAGRFAPGNTGLSRRGGLAKAGKTRLSVKLGLMAFEDSVGFATYKRSAASFRRAHCQHIAAAVGGGVCGTGPSSMVASAALQLAWSRYFYDRAAENGDADLVKRASDLANASRQNLVAAHELAAREAVARSANAPRPDVAALLAAGMVRP